MDAWNEKRTRYERKIIMAFFEDIGKKVSQTSQDAIKKTKAMAETAKLNTQISAENKIVTNNYMIIGERYVELFGDSPDENLAEYVAAIKEARRKIEEYEEQISNLKGVERCPNCGVETKEGAIFCAACGTKLPELPAEEIEAADGKICKKCGQPLNEEAIFCPGCGTRYE